MDVKRIGTRLWTNFTFRYVFGLSGVAILAIASQGYVQWVLHRQDMETRATEIALQQRFLSQRLGGTLSSLQMAADHTEKKRIVEDLRLILDQLNNNQHKLNQELGSYQSSWNNPAELKLHMRQVEEHFEAIYGQGTNLVQDFRNPNLLNRRTLDFRDLSFVRDMMSHQAGLMISSQLLSYQFKEEARIRFERLKRIELGVLTLILLLLGFEAAFVFQPVVRKIARVISELEESRERQSAILLSTIDPFITVNAQGEIIDFNPAAEATFGVPAQEVVGQSLQQLFIPPHLRKNFEKEFSRYLSRGKSKIVNSRIELEGMRADGSEFPMEISITPTSSDRYPFFAIYLRDISGRKKIEREVMQAKDAAEAALHIRSEFISRMSHEIRNPMNTILGMSDLLAESATDLDQRKYIQIQNRAGRVLLSFINDILDFSKLEARSLELSNVAFDPGHTVENVVDLVAAQAEDKGIEIAIDLDPQLPVLVYGDRRRIQQILLNLFQNAIKFTERGHICASVHLTPDKKSLVFSVADTGIGIQEKLQSKVFESFVQVDSSLTRKAGGAGLGLNICKQLVELMGGKIWMESVYGKGSKFSFTLVQPLHSEWKLRKPDETLRSKKVLLASSSEIGTSTLGKTLQGFGFQVELAPTQTELSQKLAQNESHFDFLVLDEKMGTRSGIDFLMAEKARITSKFTRVILMIPIGGARTIVHKSRDLGIECLFKPVKPSELKEFLGISGLKKAATITPIKTTSLLIENDSIPPMKVLVVDDSDDNHLVVQSFLKKTKVVLESAFNGEEAVSKVKEGAYDLVLMDVQMPILDGYGATRLIRQFEHDQLKAPIPIVALTAFDGQVDLDRCLEAGCTDHLTKPVSKKTLLSYLQRLGPHTQSQSGP